MIARIVFQNPRVLKGQQVRSLPQFLTCFDCKIAYQHSLTPQEKGDALSRHREADF